MADQEPKSETEMSKDILAPPEGIREDLVATAVKFLRNPKVIQSPLSQKRAFLQRKGLTSEEVELAISQSGAAQTGQVTSDAVVQAPGQSAAPALPQRYTEPEYTKWMKARDVLKTVTMVTGISFAAYRLYKEFLEPWIFGLHTSDKRLDNLEKVVAESMANVTSSLASIEQTLGKQQEKLQMLSHDVNSKTGGEGGSVSSLQNSQSIGDIKTELASIKGLLLNRRQFPPVPSSTPVLPSWQLASNSGDSNSNTKGTDLSVETVQNKVTFSETPAPASPTQVAMETCDDNVAADTNRTEVATASAMDTDSKDEDNETVQSLSVNESGNMTESVENEAGGLQNEADLQGSGVKVTGQEENGNNSASED